MDSEIQKAIEEIRARQKRRSVTLFKSPIQTLKIFGIVTFTYSKEWIQFLLSHRKILATLLILSISTYFLLQFEGSHQDTAQYIQELILIGGWWVFLGILSSVGLGTGLHTFVLYLGPFIAKVTMAAYECKSLDFKTSGEDSFVCPDVIGEVTIWGILRKVQFEALLWGIGTAIGELPPYFVARAARLSGESMAELDELEQAPEDNFIARTVNTIKKTALSALGRFGFFGILLFASIPNPLFDLAGITCGHFLVPFWTFFGATVVGKSFIKAHIQTVFVITMFSQQLLDYMIKNIEYFFPFTTGMIQDFLEKEKLKLHRAGGVAHAPTEKSFLSMCWDMLLITMLLYFLISIINSSVQNYLQQQDDEEIARLQKQTQGKKNS